MSTRWKYLGVLLVLMLWASSSQAEVLYNGETVTYSVGQAWDKNGSTIMPSKAAPYSAPKHIRAKIVVRNWWGSVAYMPKNFQPVDISLSRSFSVFLKSGRNANIIIQLFDANKNASAKYIVPVTTAYAQYIIPLNAFASVDLTKITAIIFAASQKANVTHTVDIDNIEVLGAAIPDPLPTPVPPTPTPTLPTPVPTVQPTPSPASGLDFGSDAVLQIHTVGDSITNAPGWRCEIFNALTKDGYKSEFIGTLVDAYPRCSATRSDGHSGYNTNNTNSEIPGWFAAIKKPELTVLMLGTNDVAWWMAEPVSAVVTRLSMLIDKIRANSPKGVIIVASIPPESSSVIDTVRVDRAKLVVDYNKGVSELIAKRKSVGEDIHFVDIFSVLTLADLYDGIHPNDAGNVKIGQAFYAKIKSLITAKPTPPTPVPPTPSPTPTPTSDPVPTGSTMKTNGRFLYDACGQKMVLRGVNHMTCWTDWAGTPRDGLPMFAEIAKTGANVVRMSWIRDAGAGTPAITTAQLDAAITNVIANKMVPMPELHDYTCNWSTQAITDVINWWTNPELTPILKKHQRYLLINFANEMSAPNVTEYVKEYSRALVALRAAGLHMPIVFDSSGCGQDENMILAAGPALIKADPDHNVIMSLHIYWTDQNAARIGTAMTNAVAADIPLIIGEFASVSVDCTTPILYKEIIKQAQLNEIGYLPWSWDHQNACGTHAMTKDVNQSFSTLWGWALEVAVTDPNSIKNTSVRSQCF